MSGEDIVLEFVLRSQRYLGLTCEQMADIAGVQVQQALRAQDEAPGQVVTLHPATRPSP